MSDHITLSEALDAAGISRERVVPHTISYHIATGTNVVFYHVPWMVCYDDMERVWIADVEVDPTDDRPHGTASMRVTVRGGKVYVNIPIEDVDSLRAGEPRGIPVAGLTFNRN